MTTMTTEQAPRLDEILDKTAKSIIHNYRHILKFWESKYHLGARTMALMELIDAGLGIVEADWVLSEVEKLCEFVAV